MCIPSLVSFQLLKVEYLSIRQPCPFVSLEIEELQVWCSDCVCPLLNIYIFYIN